MTAARAVCPGQSTSPRLGRIAAEPDGFPRSRHWTSRTESDMGWGGGWLSAIAGVRAVSLATGTLSTARIVMLAGVTEVHHG